MNSFDCVWCLLRKPCTLGSNILRCFPRTFMPAPSLQDAYSEVASLFAEFFRDLDIVPSDIIAGLVLLRQTQRSKRSSILDQVSSFKIS